MAPVVPPTGLPVEDVVDAVRDALAGRGTAVLQAPPGAGKTTVVPLRLLGETWLGDGRIVVLEPRRVAARAAAARMSELLGEGVGATVGFTTRDERRASARTRIEVVTEGILTRRLQADPALPGTGLVVFDEFHERHVQGDLGLALTLDARAGLRPDLRVLVMSATLDAEPVADLIGAEVVTSAGRAHPVALRWVPGVGGGGVGGARGGGGGGGGGGGRGVGGRGPDGPRVAVAAVAGAVRAALAEGPGDALVFLPGVGEIGRVAAALGAPGGLDVLALHGGLPPGEQDRALRPGPRRRVVLSTDLAESSVTVEGVRIVVDAGLARRPAYDPATGLSRLRTITAPRSSADQRAGRAGREGPGVAYRLWSQADHAARRAWSDPEIAVTDLAGLALELAIWGAPAGDLPWLDPPPTGAMEVATTLLEQLGALEAGRPTPLGRRLATLPLHPRLAAMLLVGGGGQHRRTAAVLAALLSERDVLRRGGPGVTADVAERLAAVERHGGDGPIVDRAAVATVRRRADELMRRVATVDPPSGAPGGGGGPGGGAPGGGAPGDSPPGGGAGAGPGGLLVAAYPDRVAAARGGGRFRLRHGGGAALDPADPLAAAPWIVAADVDGGVGGDGRIRLAASIDRADIERIGAHDITVHTRLEWDERADDLRQVTERRLDDLVLDTTRSPAEPGPATTDALVAHAVATGLAALAWTPAARTLQARAGWAQRTLGGDWPNVSDAGLAATAGRWLSAALHGATGRRDIEAVDARAAIATALAGRTHDLDRMIPPTLTLANGRRVAVDYRSERPVISARAQDLFGITEHPTIAGGRVAVTVKVLSPAGRPVQVTADLPAFWAGSWREVRKDMAGRYPKHPWPQDPATAAPPAPRDRPGSRPQRRA